MIIRVPKVRLAGVFVFAVLVAGCGKQQDTSVTPNFPPKPADHPFFVNQSTLQTINDVATGDLKRARALTGIDFNMVLLKELPKNTSVTDYAAELFNAWKIGQANNGQGILFLFIESDGVLKIEVGYSLEQVYPDAFVGSFQDSIKHYFAGRYFGDFVSGMITAMIKRAQKEEVSAILDEFRSGLELTDSSGRYESGGAGVLEGGFLAEKTRKLQLVRELEPAVRARYDSNEDPAEVVRLYLEYLSQGYNDARIGLFTEGSRYMALEYPKSPGYQKNAAREFGGPYHLEIKDDLAAVRFDAPEVMPLLLRRDRNGKWMIDVTKSWAYSQASNDLKTMNPAYGDHAWMFAWPAEMRKGEQPATPPLLPVDLNIAEEIERLEKQIKENPALAENYFALADILYFECYWIRSAMDLLEQGLVRNPMDTGYRKRLIKLSYRFPDLSRVQNHYEAIMKYDPNDRAVVREYIWFLKNYRNDPNRVAQLEQLRTTGAWPTEPLELSAGAARLHKRFFPLPEGGSFQLVVQRTGKEWHDKWRPAIHVLLTDSSNEHGVGLGVQLTAVDGANEVFVLNGAADGSDAEKVPEFLIDQQSKLEIGFEWRDRTLKMTLQGKQLAEQKVNFDPAKVKLYCRSGAARFEFP